MHDNVKNLKTYRLVYLFTIITHLRITVDLNIVPSSLSSEFAVNVFNKK